jgi:hypothetical protein
VKVKKNRDQEKDNLRKMKIWNQVLDQEVVLTINLMKNQTQKVIQRKVVLKVKKVVVKIKVGLNQDQEVSKNLGVVQDQDQDQNQMMMTNLVKIRKKNLMIKRGINLQFLIKFYQV